MTEYRLVPHPNFPTSYVKGVSVIANRPAKNELGFRFFVAGDIRELEIPAAEHPSDQVRRDELWRSTCFEAFVRPSSDPAYFETNLSPAGHWAVYQFDGYRAALRDAAASHRWFRSDSRHPDRYDISGDFLFDDLNSDRGRWRVNLPDIIEAIDGNKSYWALAHAPGPPDFHNQECFIATLPAPAAP